MNTLDHVGVYVKNLEEAVSFYETLFGFTVHSRLFDHGIHIVHMDMGSALLQLMQSGVPGTPGAGKYNHFGVHTSDYDAFIIKLKEMGIGYWEMSLGPRKRLVNFTDPSGHDIEVCETPFKD